MEKIIKTSNGKYIKSEDLGQGGIRIETYDAADLIRVLIKKGLITEADIA